MQTKHTPGPWKAVQAKSALSIKARDGCITVCNIGWILRQNYPNETEANARLIAAAPALLAALEVVSLRLDRWARNGIARGPTGLDADWPTLLTQVHDALKMAQGD